MNRRTFIQRFLLVLAAVASVATFGLVRRYRRQAPLDVDGIAAALRDHFSYLRLDDAGLAKFARGYDKLRGPVYPDENLYTNFLMASSFFANKADESLVVTYENLYDPYDGCVNPFSEFD